MREGRHDQHERRVDMINMREESTREMDNVFYIYSTNGKSDIDKNTLKTI